MPTQPLRTLALATAVLVAGCGPPPSPATKLILEAATAPETPALFEGLPTLDAAAPGAVRARFGASGTRHLDRINAVAYAPDGSRIATGSHDGSLRLTPRDGGPSEVVAYRRIAWAAAFSPDGQEVVVGTNGGQVAVVDAATGQVTRTIDVRPRVYGLGVVRAQSAVATLLARDNPLRPGQPAPDHPYAGSLAVFDLASGRELWKVPEVGSVGLAHFTEDGRFALTIGTESPLRVFDLLAREELPVPALSPTPDTATLSAEGERLWYASGLRGIRSWSRQASATSGPLPGSDAFVRGLRESRDGRWLAAVVEPPKSSGDGELRIWDLAGRTLAHRLPLGSTFMPGLAFSPDSREIAVGDGPRLVRFSLAEGEALAAGPSHMGVPTLLAVGGGGTLVATATDDAGPYVWDAATGEHRWGPVPGSGLLRALAFSPSGKQVLALAPNGPAIFREGSKASLDGPRTEELLPERREEYAVPEVLGLGFEAEDVAWFDLLERDTFRPRAQWRSHRVRVRVGETWERLGKEPAPVPGRTDGFGLVLGSVSPDGKRVAVLTSKWNLELREPGRKEPVATAVIGLARGRGALPQKILWSPDGALIFLPLGNSRLVLWDVEAWKPIRILTGLEGEVVAAAAPSEGRVVTLGRDGAGLVWDLSAGD